MKKELTCFDLGELKEEMEKNNIKHLSEVSNTGSLVLSNFGGITILINSTGDGLFYQYYDNEIEEKEIEYYSKEELDPFDYDWLEVDELYPGFKDEGNVYLLCEFLRNDR